jgi:hypothetical protein
MAIGRRPSAGDVPKPGKQGKYLGNRSDHLIQGVQWKVLIGVLGLAKGLRVSGFERWGVTSKELGKVRHDFGLSI